MHPSSIRVRFAPAPTGTMHIGNCRTALLNYLFAKQRHGTFIVRIEDTDTSRNFDRGARTIIADLHWLSLFYNEGPGVHTPFGPYFQSERHGIYQDQLNILIQKKLVYRCFCSEEDLEKKRARQIAFKMPPRYDRTCLKLSDDTIEQSLAHGKPFIWRFRLDHTATVHITDLSRGTITFDLKNFSDFPLTRSDGSFTFIFANFVDDMLMKISHVFRGEDHLSNTANQAALYSAFNAPIPIFWHMPIICNIDGKKLSKRNFGFTLHDLKKGGFLPQAINNYLATIGSSYPKEIMNLEELADVINFDHPHTTGKIKYDVEKLRWINHQWITTRLTDAQLAEAILPFLKEAYPSAASVQVSTLISILPFIKNDLYTLVDTVEALQFYFEDPATSHQEIAAYLPAHHQTLISIIRTHLDTITDSSLFIENIKRSAKAANISLKELFSLLRIALTGKANGPSIHDLITILGVDKSKERIKKILTS